MALICKIKKYIMVYNKHLYYKGVEVNSFGIPIFLSENKGHMSLEHTHPPYHYILGETNFQIANKLKNKIYEKIFKKDIPI